MIEQYVFNGEFFSSPDDFIWHKQFTVDSLSRFEKHSQEMLQDLSVYGNIDVEAELCNLMNQLTAFKSLQEIVILYSSVQHMKVCI